ncbi:MAG: tRNA-dihydrouridine synthase family protein [Candidatus Riflebacteria bacterium]|nr:tRNA-dihydrouridine synthase family protein [Candidatus Riflebacteria bacterium]
MSDIGNLIRPLNISGVQLRNNLILAPMAGVTDGPFRLFCSGFGAGLTVSELASSKALLLGNKTTIRMLRFSEQPRPFSVQIFGSNAEEMARAAKKVEEMEVCELIDINMGCPVSKVVKIGAGASLMKTPELASEIIKTVKKAVKLPVTVKCRIGWTESQINVRDFVKMVVDSGAEAVTVHARTREAGYSGIADWGKLKNMQDLCGKVPFIANGDIKSFEDIKKIHEISGAQGFMIGRGAIGNPWIFELIRLSNNSCDSIDISKVEDNLGVFAEQIAPLLNIDTADPAMVTEPCGEMRLAKEENSEVKNAIEKELCFGKKYFPPEKKLEVFREHLLESLIEHGPKGVALFRVHLFAYLRGNRFASSFRREMCSERNPKKVIETGKRFFCGE